ncbi:hypothetical protein [Lactobacillus selangorensis]|uniref:hypothetical protein n=1 Tax=Lactobacillus selangorensis TaxID=81857 RepID=UPI0007095B47|nr:hypothetical protein [Lactobacillus selangorensis]
MATKSKKEPIEPPVDVGDHVTVRKSGNVPLGFKGTIQKIYTHSALVSIDEYAPENKEVAEDLKGKTIVNFRHLRKRGAKKAKAKKAAAPKSDAPQTAEKAAPESETETNKKETK